MGTGLKIALAAALGIGGLAIAATAATAKKGFSSMLLSALQGIAAVFAVNIAGLATGTSLAVNWYSLGAGAALGVPGVISMLLLEIFFKT